jgi:hypothetical protein
MRAFLEKEYGEWSDDFVYITKNEFNNLGVEVIPFIVDNKKTIESCFQKYKPTKKDVYIGSVKYTTDFFECLNVKTPDYIGFPESISKYLHRKITLKKFGDINEPYPFFIKPATNVKQFTGSLCANDAQNNILKNFYDVNLETLVYISEPINFITEYRCFVHKRELKGIQYYMGDYTKFIDTSVVLSAIDDYTDCNVAYTLDFGLTDTGLTALVEVNDMWSIGSYGFNSKDYTRMCIDRMLEIYRTTK